MSIFEELSQLENNPEDQKYKNCSLFSIKEQDPFSTSNYLDKFTPASHNPMKKTEDLTERTYKARLSMYEQEREKKESYNRWRNRRLYPSSEDEEEKEKRILESQQPDDDYDSFGDSSDNEEDHADVYDASEYDGGKNRN
jgi:hypothetical protein